MCTYLYTCIYKHRESIFPYKKGKKTKKQNAAHLFILQYSLTLYIYFVPGLVKEVLKQYISKNQNIKEEINLSKEHVLNHYYIVLSTILTNLDLP